MNFLSGPGIGATELATGYLPGDLDRFAAIKRTVDPQDMFRIHHGRA